MYKNVNMPHVRVSFFPALIAEGLLGFLPSDSSGALATGKQDFLLLVSSFGTQVLGGNTKSFQ